MPNNYSEKVNVKNGSIVISNISYGTYNCDYIVLDGLYDIEFTLPPLPPRVYEVRLGFMLSETWFNQDVQTYIDGTPTGMTFDMSCKETGRVEDDGTFDDGVENDKLMRNLGWMKAPLVFNSYGDILARHDKSSIRKIITRRYFGSGRHKIRFRLLGQLSDKVAFDYLEFVPLKIINDPTKPEDRY